MTDDPRDGAAPHAAWEPVHAVYGWYDIPRGGFADFGGRPHAFAAPWSDERDDWEDEIRLVPIDAPLLALVLEVQAMLARVSQARVRGVAVPKSWRVLPPDETRHDVIAPLIVAALDATDAAPLRARAEFRGAGGGPVHERAGDGTHRVEVRWTPVEPPRGDGAQGESPG